MRNDIGTTTVQRSGRLIRLRPWPTGRADAGGKSEKITVGMRNSGGIFLGILVIPFVCAAVAFSEPRVWTDQAGRKVEAEYIGVSDGNVQLKRTSDGTTLHVLLESFSESDQQFIRSQNNAIPDSDDRGISLILQSLKPWYDPRSERAAFLGRIGANNIKIAVDWADRFLVSTGTRGWDRKKIFFEMPSWRVIWKNDQFDEAKGQTILTRSAGLASAIQDWQAALMPHNGGREVPREQVILMVCDANGLFNIHQYNADLGRAMQERLQAMPIERSRDIAQVLWVHNPHAAMLLAQHDHLFLSNGQINETVYSTVLTELKVLCPEHSPR